MSAKFSIVTPSFNQLDWLRLCCASVADQRDVEVEHIIQDGGTGGVAEDGGRRSAVGGQRSYELKVFEEKDEGMYDAINRGLKRATGDICGYLNCDEQYLPGALARVAERFAKCPDVDVVSGDAILVDAKGAPLSYRRTVSPSALHTRLVHLNTLSCAMFFRRRLVDEGFFFPTEFKMIGDAVFVWKLLEAKKRTSVISEPLATFTFTGSNQGQTEAARREAELWRNATDAPPQFLKWPAIALHRLRKLAAGAYRFREIRYAIYTLDSTQQRKQLETSRLGWDWPK